MSHQGGSLQEDRMIADKRRSLKRALWHSYQGANVKKIVVKVGDEFDPKFHHPFDTDWNEEFKENAILGELKGGYTYKDRVLRPTLVKINKKEEVKENE